MPRGEEWYYITAAEAVEMLLEGMDKSLLIPTRRSSTSVLTGSSWELPERDEYAEAIGQYRHWSDCDDDD